MGKRGDQGGWAPSGFWAVLKALREAQGLSQGQLARKAGCHLATVARLEQGTQEPAWPLVLLLAKGLGVTPDAFLVEDPEPPPPIRRRGRPRKAPPAGA